jgi:hypothetical protein
MADARHRLLALTYKRHWGTSGTELLLFLVGLPLINFVICALPNTARGGNPEAQELIVQILLSWMGPLAGIVGCFFIDLPAWIRFVRWSQHSCILKGDEAVLDAILGYLGYASLFIMPMSSIFLYYGLYEVADSDTIHYVTAFMESTCLLQTLILVSGQALLVIKDVGTLQLATEKCYMIRFLSLAYLR